MKTPLYSFENCLFHRSDRRVAFRWRLIQLCLLLSLAFVSTATAQPKEPPCRIKRTRADTVPFCQATTKTAHTNLQTHCFQRCLRSYSKGAFSSVSSRHNSDTSSHPKTTPYPPQAQLSSEIWGGYVSSRLEQTLHSHNPLVQQCFQRYAVSASGLLWMWVRFDVTPHGVRHVRTMCHNISNPNLRRCLLCAVSSLPLKAQKRPWRVAQSIARYPNPYDGRSRMATFRWKRPIPPHRRAGLQQICALGRRHQHTSPHMLDPFAARPCKKELACCYPCGMDGCDYVCLPSCPVALP